MDVTGKRILVVDDEEDLCEILKYNLVNEGYFTEIAHSAEEAIKRPLETFDLILLDVMMGQMSGFKFADKLKNEMKLAIAIIFLTAKNTENDILTGFSLGAEDYIIKPFSINELILRVKAVLKRYQVVKRKDSNIIRFNNLELDTNKRRILINDEHAELTKKECEILKLVLETPGKIFSRKDIITKVWGNDAKVKEYAVDVNMTRLRNKLGEYGNCLYNKSGFGYYFEF